MTAVRERIPLSAPDLMTAVRARIPLRAPDLTGGSPGEVIVDRALGTQPPYLPRYMLDNSQGTYWLSQNNLFPNHTITIDLLTVAPVRGVRILFGDTHGRYGGSGRSYLQSSIDGNTWSPLPTVEPAPSVEIPLSPPVSARYVRLHWAFIDREDKLAIRSFHVDVPGSGGTEPQLRDFAPDRVAIGTDEAVTLSWRGDAAWFQLYWADRTEDVTDVPAGPDGLRRWTSPRLRTTTGFMIQAGGELGDGTRTTRTLTTAVAVRGGDDSIRSADVARTLRVGDTRDSILLTPERADFAVPTSLGELTVQGSLTAGDLTLTASTPAAVQVSHALRARNLRVTESLTRSGTQTIQAVGSQRPVGTSAPFTAPRDGFLHITNAHATLDTPFGVYSRRYTLRPGQSMTVPMVAGTRCEFDPNPMRVYWIPLGKDV